MNTDIQLTPHFHLREFLHNGSDEGLTADVMENLRELAQRLEKVRTQLGNRPIAITSGFRTPRHNKAVGGAAHSQHMFGRAADIVVQGMAPKGVQGVLADWDGGMGMYDTFTHLDIWMKRRWSGP